MPREKWYKDGLKFKCTQCGNCCSGPPGYVWVTPEELQRIAKFLGNADGKLDRKYVRRVGLGFSLTERPDGDCVFLRRENGKAMCSIYPVRPLQCRTWPFWEENLRSQDEWEATHARTCPGMNTGTHYTLVQIENIRKQKDW